MTTGIVNVLASELQPAESGKSFTADTAFDAVSTLHRRVEGFYAAIAVIAGGE